MKDRTITYVRPMSEGGATVIMREAPCRVCGQMVPMPKGTDGQCYACRASNKEGGAADREMVPR